jgi:hypothetical protein
MECLNLENWANMLSCSIDNQLARYAAYRRVKASVIDKFLISQLAVLWNL